MLIRILLGCSIKTLLSFYQYSLHMMDHIFTNGEINAQGVKIMQHSIKL